MSLGRKLPRSSCPGGGPLYPLLLPSLSLPSLPLPSLPLPSILCPPSFSLPPLPSSQPYLLVFPPFLSHISPERVMWLWLGCCLRREQMWRLLTTMARHLSSWLVGKVYIVSYELEQYKQSAFTFLSTKVCTGKELK